MAAEPICMDTYYRAPTLHYVTSADDVIQYHSRRYVTPGHSRGAWTSHRDHHDIVPRQQISRQAPTSTSLSGSTRGEVWYCRRKLSADDGASSRPSAAGGVAVIGGTSRQRALPTSASDDAAGAVNVEDWSSNRRRLSAWSPLQPMSTLSRTLSEHTLDRSGWYRGAQCRDDLLDESSVDGDGLESILSPPRIAPVSGKLSLVCSVSLVCHD